MAKEAARNDDNDWAIDDDERDLYYVDKEKRRQDKLKRREDREMRQRELEEKQKREDEIYK